MEASQVSPSHIPVSQTHPLLLAAAASVTVLSLAGVGVLAGWLPGPGAHGATPAPPAAAPAAAPISIQQHVTVPQEKAKVATTSAERAPVSPRRVAPAQSAASRAPASPYQRTSADATPAPYYDDASPAPRYPAASHEPAYRVASSQAPICNECGIVEAVREVAVEPKGSGGGAIAGGVVGGLIANQIGKGATRDIATVLGALGGAYAGNHIEKSVKESKRYDVVVRFEDGTTRTFPSETPPAWQSGDRVKLQNGLLTMGGGNSNRNPGAI
jgi:outer membrane lipoprotein SlyB